MTSLRSHRRAWTGFWLALALLLAIAGVVALRAAAGGEAPSATSATETQSGETLSQGVAAMEGAAIHYSPGWRVSSAGADPAAPAAPETTPSGVLTFTYAGRDLALRIAPGDYWGYLYVTVDGAPANLLPAARNHQPPAPAQAGYKPLYAPERATAAGPGEQWLPVHHAEGDGPHSVVITLWRSWGQIPLRAVAVDALAPAGTPAWPGVLLLVAALWCATPLWLWLARTIPHWLRRSPQTVKRGAHALLGARAMQIAVWLAASGAALVVASMGLRLWWLCAAGILLWGVAAVTRPVLWYAGVLFALPFYFRFTLPLLPGRAVNLVDAGVYLGLAIALAHAALVAIAGTSQRTRIRPAAIVLLAGLASWALVAAFAADYRQVALREWRTVFLMAAVLAAGLVLTLHVAARPRGDVALLIGAWLAGAATVSLAALILYPAEWVTVAAEGVTRLRAFYGSPNNLALYLERTLAVSLALALFARPTRLRLAALIVALPQAVALLLTFSRGALLLALPAMLMTLFAAGWATLRAQGRSRRVLWWLAAPLLIAAAALAPFLTTERFSDVANLAQGTGFQRVNLWSSSWQMALDHPLLGVGPDNFLYAYRSGYILPQVGMEPNLNHPHTWLLDWWTRLGVPGIVLGLAFWLTVVVGLVRKVRGEAGVAALAVGLLAATVTALAHGLVDVSYALPDLMAVWAMTAVVASIGEWRVASRESEVDN